MLSWRPCLAGSSTTSYRYGVMTSYRHGVMLSGRLHDLGLTGWVAGQRAKGRGMSGLSGMMAWGRNQPMPLAAILSSDT